ncbi:hypothetical protein BZG36_00413 [Bifiguratus adelaidae]|uniref:Small-subunit processome Utp12 domain-containing protein n=1 Tax=Bifiguratus adelaidae TaxID=1938954 RepID=A0A261Y7P3_9FUNG|nr:hypothetical protein BZG36_00413 [Bifiguratus adelaidae]
MKSDFKFSNLCGTVYRQGNLVYTPDGNSILSPVGNRVSLFDLVNNKSFTFPFEMRKNIARIALNPKATLMITVDEDGRALLVNFPRRVVLHQFHFKEKVYDIKFSPDGRYFAVTHGKHVQVWRAPGYIREFSPFVLHRTYTGHYDQTTSINWSSDSKYFVSGSKDMSARIFSLDPIEGFTPSTLSGHREVLKGAWFSEEGNEVYTVSKDGALFVWKNISLKALQNGEDDEDGEDMDVDEDEKLTQKRWRVTARHYFHQSGARVVSCAFHPKARLLVIGFSNGIFGIWEMPEFNNIHTLSITQQKIDTVSINATGEWLAFGSSRLGQLLVWEWQSESYVLKQQGHFYDMNTLSYSSDGHSIATGGDDGKVKVWNTTSGFCFVTFSEHSGGVSAVEFAKQGQVLFSASLDGTVRAFDLVRYRNFRTFTSPSPVQFSALAVDPSGEIVCAGSMDSFEIFVWSVQTGKLLDILAGHEGPISSLTFSSTGLELVSGSWDHTARIWDVFGRKKSIETFQHQSDVLAVAYRPDGKEIAASTLDGQIAFWDIANAKQVALIEGRRDIAGGRKATDRMTAENNSSGKSFNSLCYTSDGTCILGGGNSKYICIYDIHSQILLRKFQISQNLSFEGTQEFLNSKNMTDAGPLDLIMDDDDLSDTEDRIDKSLPGAAKGDLSLRKTRPEIRSKCVRFSPTGRAFAAASTEGLIIYSLDEGLRFDPFDLEIDITPDSVLETLAAKEYLKSLVMAFRLNEPHIIAKVYDSIPAPNVDIITRDLPEKYLDRLLAFLANVMEQNPRLEYNLTWLNGLLRSHGRYLKDQRGDYASIFRALQKGVSKARDDVTKLCDDNNYTIKYLLSQRI